MSVWALVGAIVLYLAIDGGGYDIIVRSQAGVVVWWVVLIGALWGLFPAGRLSRSALAALGLFGGFVAWTAIASTWSVSSERSLEELSRVACYLGILALAIVVHRDRSRAVRQTVAATATAIVVVASIALISRLRPDLLPAAQQTSSFLHSAPGRLGWPLDYWNALAALVAMGLPLLLAIATSARRIWTQALAAGSIPLLALCGYLTFSRGGAIAGACALIVFIAFAGDRLPKLLTATVAALGSTALVAGAVHRHAIENGLANGAARHEGSSLLVAIILVCVGVGAVQAGIGFAVRHGTPPRALRISVHRARALFAIGATLLVAAALIAGLPSALSHTWRDFKHPRAEVLKQTSLGRFGNASGEGRYDYWRVALNEASSNHLLGGSGPGTFQLIWLPRAPYNSYVENAHSLYVETLSDVGLVGLALLLGFLVLAIGRAVWLVVRSSHGTRTRAAGIAAAMTAFCVSAGFDWIWQVPVLPAMFLLLFGAVLASSARRKPRPTRQWPTRILLSITAIACLIAIAVPLAAASAVRKSQAASTNGNQALALADARTAARIEPGAATPQLQAALVLELQGDPGAALPYARRAAADEPANWSTWLVVSRLFAETGHPQDSVAAYVRARSLNPRSPVFRQ